MLFPLFAISAILASTVFSALSDLNHNKYIEEDIDIDEEESGIYPADTAALKRRFNIQEHVQL